MMSKTRNPMAAVLPIFKRRVVQDKRHKVDVNLAKEDMKRAAIRDPP